MSGTLSLYCILTIDPRVLKHMKAYELFDDVRPTIRNKPSGLINTWYDITTTPSPHQMAPQIHGYSPNPPLFYTPPQPYMDQSPPLLSLPSTQLPIPAQFAEPSFPWILHTSMEISAMPTLPLMSDPPLPTPSRESNNIFQFPSADPSHVCWESAVSGMNPVTIFFPLTILFSINCYRPSAYLAPTHARTELNMQSVFRISHLPSITTSAMTSSEESSNSYSQAVPHGLTRLLRPSNKSSIPPSQHVMLSCILMTLPLYRYFLFPSTLLRNVTNVMQHRQLETSVFCDLKLEARLSKQSLNTSQVNTTNERLSQRPPEQHTFRPLSWISSIHSYGSTSGQAIFLSVVLNSAMTM